MAVSNGSEFFELELMSTDIGDSSFARPSNAESVARDEEDLVWAAIERLPSLKRSNLALLRDNDDTNSGGKRIFTIDVTKLDRNHRELLVQKALDTPEQDNYKLVSGIKERFKRYLIAHEDFFHLNLYVNLSVLGEDLFCKCENLYKNCLVKFFFKIIKNNL